MAPQPSTIGRYRPVTLLGSGAMGTVYRAHASLIDRMVTVKVLRTDAVDPAMRTKFFERFRQEVQAAGRCSHPAITGVYDYVADAVDPVGSIISLDGRLIGAHNPPCGKHDKRRIWSLPKTSLPNRNAAYKNNPRRKQLPWPSHPIPYCHIPAGNSSTVWMMGGKSGFTASAWAGSRTIRPSATRRG
jgi:hypothetical protein